MLTFIGLTQSTNVSALIGDGGIGGLLLDKKSQYDVYFCRDCNAVQARAIAIQQAPENSCSIYRNGRNASYCESTSKEILVPSIDSRAIYKFIITTSIDSRNRPQISLIGFPVTAKQRDLINNYFEFYNELTRAVSLANKNMYLDSKKSFSQPHYISRAPSNSIDDSIDCSGHPTFYFSSNENARYIENNVEKSIANYFRETSFIGIKFDRLVSGLGFQIGKDSIGGNVSFQYVENDLIAFTSEDDNNRLAFDVDVRSGVGDPSGNVRVQLRYNQSWTNIDGFQASQLFGGDETDLGNQANASDCLRKLLRDKGEKNKREQEPEPDGGVGSGHDPITGSDADTNFNPVMRCRYSRDLKTCSTTKDGVKTCRYSTIKWIDSCANKPNL